MTFEEIVLKSYDLTDREVLQVAKKTLKEYEIAMKAIDDQLKAVHLQLLSGVPPQEYFNYMSKAGRYDSLLASVQGEYLAAAKKVNDQVYQASKLAISNTYYRQMYALNWIDSGVSTVFTVLNPAVIDVSVYGTPKVWKELKKQTLAKIEKTFGALGAYQPEYGSLIEKLAANKAKDLAAIDSAVKQGLIKGESYKRATARLSQVIDSSKSQTLRIIRTESHRNMMAGNYAMTQAARAEGVDIRRQIISAGDARMRSQSEAVNHKKENNEGYFEYPGGALVRFPGNSGVAAWDINDREAVIDNVEGWEPELTRGINPVTGERDIISFKDFDKWKTSNRLKTGPAGRILPKAKPIVRSITKTIPKAKTIGEAERLAIQYIRGLREAKYKGLNVDFANEANRALYEMQEKYGDLGLDVIRSSRSTSKGADAWASYSYSGYSGAILDKKIVINYGNRQYSTAGGDLKKYNKIFKAERFDTGWNSDSDFHGVMVHEIGHILTYRVGTTENELRALKYKLAQQMPQLAEGISQYAQKNSFEAIAEAICRVERGEKIPEPIKRVLIEDLGLKL